MFFLALCTAIAAAPSPVKAVFDPKAPLPSTEEAMDKLKGLLSPGRWSCEGNVVPPDGKSPRNARVDLGVQTLMKGRWLKVTSYPALGPQADGELIEFITFEPNNDTFVRVTLDAQGGHSALQADNTDGARLTFSGHQMLWDKRRDSRIVWEAQDDGLHITWDVSGEHGDWVRIRALTCRAGKGRDVGAPRTRRNPAAAGHSKVHTPAPPDKTRAPPAAERASPPAPEATPRPEATPAPDSPPGADAPTKP